MKEMKVNFKVEEKIGTALINPRALKIDLSIVIPVFNKYNFTKACLEDLFQLPFNNEIIVVDNGSSDETQEELKKLSRPNFKYVRNGENYGFARACNIGYTHSTGENVLFLNNDIRVKSNHCDWTKILTDAIESNPNSLVGPTAGYVDPANNFTFVYETGDPNKTFNYMGGWCLSASRETFEKLEVPRVPSLTAADGHVNQIFSEEFGLAYFEDTDMGFRATAMGIGFKLMEIPVVHFGQITSKQINTGKLYSEAKQIFIKKWGSK